MIKLRKLLACLMIVCMAFSLMPLAAFATEGEPCTHVWQDGGEGTHICTECGEEAGHSFEEGVCTVCGAEEPADPNAEAANNAPAEPADEEGGAAEETYAAQIGENGYATLAEALAAMQDGDTVTLLSDAAEDAVISKAGVIDFNGCTISGAVTIGAAVTLKNGAIENTAGDAVIITDGGLTLDNMAVSGNTGISVDIADVADIADGAKKDVSIAISNSTIEGNCGIASTGANADKVNANIVCKAGAKIIAGEYTAKRAIDVVSGSFSTEGEGIELTGEILIENGRVNISCGEFMHAYINENCKDVTITGGHICVAMKDHVEDGYACKADGLESCWVVPGYTVNGVTVSVDVTGGADGAAAFSCDKDAIDVKKLLESSNIKFEQNDAVTIMIVPKVEKTAGDGIKYVEYSISPEAKISVQKFNQSVKNYDPIAVTNDMLSGEITVAVKKDATFNIQTIVHTHDDGSKSIYTSGDAASTSTFRVYEEYNEVRFKVASFSSFAIYEDTMVAEVYKADGSLKAYCRSDEEILSNLEDGCTVKLLDDLTGASLRSVDLKNGGSATLDLAGHKFSGADGVYAIDIVGGSLTIMDSSAEGTGEISGAPAIKVGLNATVTLESGKLSGTGYGVEVNGAKAKFIMEDGTVSGTDKAVYVELGSAEIHGGMIDGVSEDVGVKSVALEGIKVDIYGGSFKHEVPKVQCADGYVPCADAKNPGRFSVEPISEPVARAEDALGVDKGTFSTVQDAINAAGLGGKVTLLRDNGDYATVSRSIVIDGAGCRMKNLTVMSIAGVKIMNLRADTVTVSANAKAELSGENVFTELVNNGALCEIIDGRYLSHTGSGTYAISGGVFGNEVTQDECALVPVTGKLTGTAASLTKYTPALNTDPETKDAYPYTVEVAPAPRITGISNNAYFQKGSSSTLTIYTDGDYDELVKAGTIYRCLHVYNANGTDLISSRYYTVEEDANGYAVITIANSFLRNRPTGTYSVQVDFTTGVTQLEDFRVGTSATPKTGDESNIGLWIGIMACSAIIIGCGVFVLVHKNKKNKK